MPGGRGCQGEHLRNRASLCKGPEERIRGIREPQTVSGRVQLQSGQHSQSGWERGALSRGRAGRKGQTNSGRTCPRRVHGTTGLALNRAPQIGPSELWEVAGETELQYQEMTKVSKQESLST